MDANVWRSCCWRIDRRAVLFFTQLALTIPVIGFCFYQLLQNEDCPAQTAYLNILTGLLGYWLPNPRMEAH